MEYYKDYFFKFVDDLSAKLKLKIFWTIRLIETTERISERFFKHIENTNGLYEIRVYAENKAIRIFCFFDNGRLIIAINGFVKKSQKTPANEIKLALKIKKDYETEQKLNASR